MTEAEMIARMKRLEARAERAERALERLHGEQERAPWFAPGAGDAAASCPYRGLIDTLDALILFIDDEEMIRHANACAAEYLGIPLETLEGMSVRDLLDTTLPPGPDHEAIVEWLLSDPAVPRTDEVDLLLPDGSEGCISWARRPVFDPDGELLGVVAVGSDVSDRRASERQSKLYQEALRSLTSEFALAEERQRRSIATRIHEEISQNLAYAKLRVGSLNGCAEDKGCESTVGEINQLLDDAIAGTRALAFELSPPMLHELGFSEAVAWLTEQFCERHEIDCEFHDESDIESVPHAVSVTLFRAIAELLSNIAEHADAEAASVSIGGDNGALVVEVSDDGRGFNPEVALDGCGQCDGFGLFSIRERLGYLGGELEIESDPGNGTHVKLIAPVNGESV